jgi:hypothetical protein
MTRYKVVSVTTLAALMFGFVGFVGVTLHKDRDARLAFLATNPTRKYPKPHIESVDCDLRIVCFSNRGSGASGCLYASHSFKALNERFETACKYVEEDSNE